MIVDVPEHGLEVEFPDGMAPDAIQKVMKEKFPPKQSVAAVEAKYGPLDTAPPTPPHFDWQGLAEINAGATTGLSDQSMSATKEAISKTFDYAVKPWMQTGFSAAESFNRGMATFATHLDTIAGYIEDKTGMERGKIFERAAKTYNENSEYWKKRAEETGSAFLPELLGEAVGGGFPGIAEFVLNVPYAAVLGAAKANKTGGNELTSALTEAAKRYSLGKVFEMMHPLKQYLRAPAMGAVFAGQAATEGASPREIVKSFGTGALYSAMSPGGRYGLDEIKNNARSYLERDIERAQEIKAAVEAPTAATETPTITPQEAQHKAEADKLGITFNGTQATPGLPPMAMFTDPKTGLEFSAQEGAHLPEVLGKVREKAAETNKPDALALPEPDVKPVGEKPDMTPGKETATLDKGQFPVEQVKVSDIGAKPEDLQFKLDTNAEGVQEPLKGNWNELAAGNFLLWEAKDGNLYVANGHHRLDLAKQKGVDTVNAQVLKESDGYTINDARRVAAEANILEGKGTIYDQSEYFRLQPDTYTPDVARQRGIAGRGYTIGRFATPDTYTQFRTRAISPESAEAISKGAPNDASLQNAGVKYSLAHPRADAYEIENFIKALSTIKRPSATADLFGFDDSAIQAAEKMGKAAAAEIRSLRDKIAAVQGAAKRPETAKELGVDVKDPEAIKGKITELKGQIESWGRWSTNPELVAELKQRAGLTEKKAAPAFDAPTGNLDGTSPAETFGLSSPGLKENTGILTKNVEKAKTQGMFDNGTSFAPQADFRRMPEGAPIEGNAPMGRSDIKKFLEDNLLVPIRTGRFRSPGALGIFKLKGEVIRTKFANDIETIAHEIGHALQKFLWPESVQAKQGARGMSALPFAPYSGELTPLATQPRAGQPPETEGFAEFIRLYITHNEQAKQRAPEFYSYFNAILDRKSPETKAIFEEARKRYDVFMQQPALQRVLSQISIGKKESKAITVDDLYSKWIDDLHPLENIVKEMARGEDVPMSQDPYKLARLLKGWAGKAEAFLKNAPFKFDTYEDIPGAKSLKEILDPVRDNLDEFRAYIVSKRAQELAGRGVETGILKKDSAAVVAENDAKYGPVFEELKQFQDHTLNYLKDSGLLSKDGYEQMKTANQDYVPFYRVMEDQKNAGAGSGLQSRTPIKTIKGSWRDIVDPLESIVKNTFLYINLAEKNAVGTALVDLSNSKEGLGQYVEKIPKPMQKFTVKEVELLSVLQRFGKWTETTKYRETQSTVGEKITNLGADGEKPTGGARAADMMEKQALDALMARGRSENEARTIIEKIKKAPNLETKTKIIEKTIEKLTVSETVKEFGLDIPEGVVDIFRPAAFVPKDGVISVWKDGDQSLYQVPTELSRAYQALDKETMHTLFKILAYPASWLRAGATLTPEFIGRNPVRDQWGAFINSKYGFVPGFDFMRGVFHMAAKDQAYWDFKKAGGDHSMLVSMDRDYLQDNLGDVLTKYPLSRVVKNPIEALRMLSELGEMGTRLGEFTKGVAKEGESKAASQKAALAAREVSLDFNRSGTAVRGAVNAIYAFSNAQIQDLNKIYRQFKDEPVNTSIKVALAITLPSVLLAAANHDDPRYKDVPQWQKDLFWIVIPNRITQAQWDKMTVQERADQSKWITGSIWRIPKPFTLGIMFGSVPERAVNYLINKDPHAFDGMLSTINRGIGMNMLPTAFIPITENWANKSMYFDRSIVPRGLENVMPEYQYSEYTSETAKALGKLIGHLPQVGETGAASPAFIENLVRGWSGGLGKYALDIVGAGLKATGLADKGVEQPSSTGADIPFLKAFTVRYPSADTLSIQRFYDNFQKADTANKTIKHLVEGGQSETAIKLWQESGMQDLSGVQQALGNIRQVIKAIETSPTMTANEKREQVDILYLQMTEVAGYGNNLYDQIKKASTIGGKQ